MSPVKAAVRSFVAIGITGTLLLAVTIGALHLIHHAVVYFDGKAAMQHK